MGQIYYENLDTEVRNAIIDSKLEIDEHLPTVASSSQFGHVKIDDATIKVDADGKIYAQTELKWDAF